MIYRVHKWIALTASAALLGWLLSGIVMVIPPALFRTRAGEGAKRPAPVDFKRVRVTVAEAVGAVESDLGGTAPVAQLQIMRFREGLAYEVVLTDGRRRLVDALTGQPVAITRPVAEAMAAAAMPGAAIVETTPLARRDFYFFGALPAHRVRFADARGTVVYVSATGQVTRADRWTRAHRWITSVHEFGPLNLITNDERLRRGLLVLFAVIAVAAVCSGLFIALLQRRWTPSRR